MPHDDGPGYEWQSVGAEAVREAYRRLNTQRRLEFMGVDTRLTDVWLKEEDATVELWIAWEEDVADA